MAKIIGYPDLGPRYEAVIAKIEKEINETLNDREILRKHFMTVIEGWSQIAEKAALECEDKTALKLFQIGVVMQRGVLESLKAEHDKTHAGLRTS